MSSLQPDIVVTQQDLYTQTSPTATTGPYQAYIPQLGVRSVTGDGREFRLCVAGGTTLVIGKLQQAPAEITNHQNMVVSTAAIGATSITVTLGATAVTANQYAQGWLIITTSTGLGYQYKVSGHPAANASATCVLQLEDAIQIATVTATSKGDLVLNPYSGVIVNPATASSTPVGACIFPITTLYYGWLQTKGVASLLADGTVVVGTSVCASNGTAGAVEATAGVQALVGTAVTGIATTEYGAINMNLV